MSDASRDELLRRREQLLLRSSVLRNDWSRQVQALRTPLHRADQVRDGAHWLLQHPEWPIGVALVILVLRPGRTMRWVGFALQGYGVYRRVQRLMAKPGR